MSDKIEEIRERYAGYSLNSGNAGKANEDRGWLLAEVEQLRADNEQLRADNKRLREALKPFALEAKTYDPPEGDDGHPAWASRFTCGNLRDARNALEGKP